MERKPISKIKGRSKKTGLAPGTIVYIGKKEPIQTKIRKTTYNNQEITEKEIKISEKTFISKKPSLTSWLDVIGLQNVEIIKKIGREFNLHPLVLEDIANTGQRPKLEDYNYYLFAVIKNLHYHEENKELKTEQISIILGSNWLISFQENEKDPFNPIRERLRKNTSIIRKNGADYLLYSLIDSVVDNYFVILEKIGEQIEEIEDELIENPTPETLQTLHKLKRQMIILRKSVWPLREVISKLERWEIKLIKKSTHVFLRDIYDHTIQAMDAIESFRDMLSGMLDIYLSSISNRMNEVMKVLTIIATIFIPLTLVAGIYGMNFRIMPELDWIWGYPLVLFLMLVIGLIMLVYFKGKKWL